MSAQETRRCELNVHTAQLRFSDFDQFGHVNHARIITLCEDHRVAMFRDLDDATGEHWTDGGFVVARVEVDYLTPITPDEQFLDITATIESIGRTSIRVQNLVASGNRVLARQLTVVVRVENQRSIPITDAARGWLESFNDRVAATPIG